MKRTQKGIYMIEGKEYVSFLNTGFSKTIWKDGNRLGKRKVSIVENKYMTKIHKAINSKDFYSDKEMDIIFNGRYQK